MELADQGRQSVGRRRIIAAIAVMIVSLMSVFIGIRPASASEATVMVSGSSWLGGGGVPACAPSTNDHCGGQMHAGGVSSNWWQCVELAQRLYSQKGWHSGTFGVAYAYQIYDNAASLGMTRQAQGSITSIVTGDMIIHTSADGGGAGHVSVVDSVNGSAVSVVEQNFDNSAGWGSYTWNTTTKSLSRGTMHIYGVVHDPDNNLPTNPGKGGGQAVNWAPSAVGFFARGSDGLAKQVYTTTGTTGAWTNWFAPPLSGGITSEPAAVSRATNLVHLFARGTDSSLVQAYFDNGWTGWSSLGGCISAEPSVAAYDANNMFVFYKSCSASGDNVGYKGWNSVTGWSNWVALSGGIFTSAPAAVSWAPGRIDLFGRATNNELSWKYYVDGSGWSPWISLGGCLGSAPAVTSWGTGRLDVFVLGCSPGDNIAWRSFSNGSWGNWTSVPNGAFSAVPSAVSQVSGEIDLFGYAQDPYQTLVTRKYRNGAWDANWTLIAAHP